MKFSDIVLAGAASLLALGGIIYIGSKKGALLGDDAIRKRVTDIARAQVGKRELNRYFAAVAPDFLDQNPEWCGIFALWVLHEAGLGPGVKWEVGKGFLYKLPQTKNPKPGDIAYYTKFQHQAVVVDIRNGTEVDLINGNGKGGVVSESTKAIGDAAAYYSIQPWIDAAVKAGAG